MAESRIAQIVENLRAAIDGSLLSYTDSPVTCEQQRLKTDPKDRYPYCSIVGPEIDPLGYSSGSCHVQIHLTVWVTDMRLNDDDPDSEPISSVMRNVPADIVKTVMIDSRRGGLANWTRFDGAGPHVDPFTGAPEYMIWVSFVIDAFTNTNDPYLGG